jgi:hypothetical protein
MDKLEAVEAEIAVTKEKLAMAETAGNDALMIMYGNNLTELRKEKNLLSTGTGNLLSNRRSISLIFLSTDMCFIHSFF